MVIFWVKTNKNKETPSQHSLTTITRENYTSRTYFSQIPFQPIQSVCQTKRNRQVGLAGKQPCKRIDLSGRLCSFIKRQSAVSNESNCLQSCHVAANGARRSCCLVSVPLDPSSVFVLLHQVGCDAGVGVMSLGLRLSTFHALLGCACPNRFVYFCRGVPVVQLEHRSQLGVSNLQWVFMSTAAILAYISGTQ